MADTRDALSAVVSLQYHPSSSDIDRLLDRNEITIRNLPEGEANKHYRLQTLAAIEAELASVVAGHGAPLRALVMHAELATQLRNWPEAAQRWQRVARQSAEHRALAQLKSTTALRNMGNLHAAEIVFRRVKGQRKNKAYIQENSALNAAINDWMSARLIHNALDQMKVCRNDNAIDLFRTAMFLKGTDDSTLQFADSVFRKLMQLDGKGSADSASAEPVGREPPGRAGSPRVVLSSGFGWSGTGAVTDYLREFAPVSLPFGTTELACFEAECSAKSILEAAMERRGSMKEELVDFFMVRVLGMAKDSHDAKTTKKVAKLSLINFFRGSPYELEGLRTACVGAFEAIYKASHSTDAPERKTKDSLRSLFGEILRLKANDNDLLMLNNAIHARNIHLIELLPNSTGLVVDRDPRDKYVSRLIEGNAWDVDSFISRTKLHLARVGKALEKREIARCVEVVRFEDFVSSAEVRRAVLDRLDLTGADRKGKQRFFPEQSQQNIGIYREHPNQKDIERIHKELSPHLIEPTL